MFDLNSKAGGERVSTGDPVLDQELGGGFPPGSVILLLGGPGVGKTTFGAHFLHARAKVGHPGIYVLFNEDRGRFVANMASFGLDFERLENENLVKVLDFVPVTAGSLQTVLEEILRWILKLKAETLVIDPINPIAEAIREQVDVRATFQTFFTRMVRSQGCVTMLVGEAPLGDRGIGFRVEEFLVDGVLRLDRQLVDGRTIRTLDLMKIRGVAIWQPRLYYTLHTGFRVLRPVRMMSLEGGRIPVVPHPSKEVLSTGIPDLDRALGGGLQRGTYNLIELGDRVSIARPWPITPLMVNFAAQGHPVFIVPAQGMSSYQIRRTLAAHLGREALERVKIVDYGPVAKKEPYMINLKGRDVEEDMEELWKRILEEQVEARPTMSVVGFDTIEYIYGPEEGLRVLGLDVARVRNLGDVRINIARPSMRIIRQLSDVADIHLRIDERDGVLFIYGVKPHTPLYGMEFASKEGRWEIELIPVT